MNSNRKFFDEAFTEVFSNRKIIESLLIDFVGESWVGQIDFDTMSIRKSVFKGIRKSKRESDLLITFRLKDGSGFSIFVLLEFQSSPEKMITRILEYLARIYQEQMQKYHALFPVVPLVIYNGEEKWRESTKLSDSFLFTSRDLRKYIPDFKYILIDERRFPDELLRKLKNAVSYFFLLDKTDLRKQQQGQERIIGILKKLKKRDREVFELLGRYISGLMEYRGVENITVNNYTEDRGKPMLEQSLDKLIEESIQKGREEGIEKKAVEDARKMIEKGYPLKDICEITSLSREKVEKLKEKQ